MTEVKSIAPLRRRFFDDVCDELEIDPATVVAITLHPRHVEANVLSAVNETGRPVRYEVITLIAPIDAEVK
jgi:hypothetical protein